MERLEDRRLLTVDIDFADPSFYQTEGKPSGITTADLNADGHVDLVVNNSQKLGVRLGRGDGTFDSAVFAPFTGQTALGLSTADFDGDGNIDVAAARVGPNSQRGIHMGLNEGVSDGQWQGFRHQFFPMSSYDAPQAVAVGDLDGDGDVDLVVGDPHRVPVLLNQGMVDGQWQGFADPVDYPGGGHSSRVALGDLDEDGDLDLVVGHYSGQKISVRLGNGDGTFSEPEEYSVAKNDWAVAGVNNLGVAGNIWSMAMGDLDGDGDLDVVASTYTRELAVLIGRGDGTFEVGYTAPASADLVWLTAADFDRDGDLDLAAGDSGPAKSVYLLANSGDGVFVEQGTSFEFRTRTRLTSADLDGDGRPDLVGVDFPSRSVGVMLNRTEPLGARRAGDANLDGVFNQLDIVEVLQAAKYLSGQPATFAEGDWNADGVFDQFDIIEALASGAYSPGNVAAMSRSGKGGGKSIGLCVDFRNDMGDRIQSDEVSNQYCTQTDDVSAQIGQINVDIVTDVELKGKDKNKEVTDRTMWLDFSGVPDASQLPVLDASGANRGSVDAHIRLRSETYERITNMPTGGTDDTENFWVMFDDINANQWVLFYDVVDQRPNCGADGQITRTSETTWTVSGETACLVGNSNYVEVNMPFEITLTDQSV